MSTKYRVVQVKGTKPETFIVVGIDFAANAITNTSESMHEPEMRSYLQKQGASKKISTPGSIRPAIIRDEIERSVN